MCATCKKLRLLLIIKTGYSQASGKHAEKLRKQSAASENLVVEKLRALDISINLPDCAISLLESRCDWIASAPTQYFMPIDRSSITGRLRVQARMKERRRALKIIYARRNNHISRLRRGDDGTRKIEKRDRISAPDGHRKLVFVFICLSRKYISSARVLNHNRHAPTLSNKRFNLSRIGPRSRDNKI